MPLNDYYVETRAPKPRERLRSEPLKAEFKAVEQAFSDLPSKNELAGDLQVLAAETSTSAANVYVLASEFPVTDLVVGTTVRFFVVNTNTGAATVDVDGTGAKDIVAIDGSALTGNEMVATWPVEIVYDGTRFRMLISAKSVTATLVLESALTPLTLERGQMMSPVVLSAASGGVSPYTYAVSTLPDGMVFAANTRTLSGTPTTLGTTTVRYTVTDGNSVAFQYQFVIKIVPVVLALATPDERVLELNTNYDFTLPAATGGTTPYTYTLTGLPDGLVFDPSNREVSGTPAETGLFSATYTATDSGTPEQTAQATLTITVRTAEVLELPDPPDRVFAPNANITAFSLPNATGGLAPYTYIVVGLPQGLTFDDDALQISGTTGNPGIFSVIYRVVDDDGTQVEQAFLMTIEQPGRRYIAVLSESDATSVSAAELQSGNNYGPTVGSLVLPGWSGTRKIVIGQPDAQDDFTRISLGGLGNSISDFTKQTRTVTVNGIDYKVWVSNELQGDVIAGETITVSP